MKNQREIENGKERKINNTPRACSENVVPSYILLGYNCTLYTCSAGHLVNMPEVRRLASSQATPAPTQAKQSVSWSEEDFGIMGEYLRPAEVGSLRASEIPSSER